MIYPNNCYTDLMILGVMACVIYSAILILLTLLIFYFPLVFKISKQFVEIYVYG